MSDMLTMVRTALAEQIASANEDATAIAAATTDRAKLIHDYLTDENTTDPQVKAFQEFLEKAQAAIEEQTAKANAHAESKVPGGSPEEVDKRKETYKGKVDQIKAARKFAATIPGYSEEEFNKDLPELKNLRGSTAGKGGTGGKRPRLNSVEYRTSAKGEWVEVWADREDKDGNKVRVANFTVLAAALNKAVDKGSVTVKDLQAAAFDAAGTDDLNTLDGKPFEFAVTVGETNVFVKVAPKHKDAE